MPVIIGRRGLIAALGAAAAWPLVARAQRPTKILKVETVVGAGNQRSSPQWAALKGVWLSSVIRKE